MARIIDALSDTTLEFDQTEKAKLYAANGIPDYWIADLNSKRIEVRRKPIVAGDGGTGYSEFFTVSQGQSIAPLCSPDLTIPVEGLIP